jgi:transposase
MRLNHTIGIWSSVEQEWVLWGLSEKYHLEYLTVKQIAKKQKGSGTQQLTKARKKLSYSMHNLATLGRFAQFLTYKAIKAGKRVIRIDDSYMFQHC